MKRLLTILGMLFAMSLCAFAAAQEDRDEQMINASLRFIKEKANLTKKEYQKFAGIYTEYNEQLAKLNRELKPENPDYLKRWNTVNDEYTSKLKKELPDTTRTKIGIAQWELGQKIWNQWSERNRHEMDMQTQMWIRSAQVNRQFWMMQPQVMDARRHQMEHMERYSEQQRQWWENFWKNRPDRPDSIMNHPMFRPNAGMYPGQFGPQVPGRPRMQNRGMPVQSNDSTVSGPFGFGF